LLKQINFKHDESFCKEIVSDERSYNFKSITQNLEAIHLSELHYSKAQEFLLSLNRLSQDSKALMDVLGEIPDKFLDPISFDLINDPVKLPSSGMIMDRKVIKQHLLNDEHDPFNRAPLKYNDLVDAPEFKKEIEMWIKEKMQANKKKKKIINNMEIEEEKVPEEEASLDPVLNKLN